MSHRMIGVNLPDREFARGLWQKRVVMHGTMAESCKGSMNETGGEAMSLRKEVKEYISSCEHLLSDCTLSTAVPFSPTERGSIDYYPRKSRN